MTSAIAVQMVYPTAISDLGFPSRLVISVADLAGAQHDAP